MRSLIKKLKDFYDGQAAEYGVAGTPILAWTSFIDTLNENFDGMDAWKIRSPLYLYLAAADLYIQNPPTIAPDIDRLLKRLNNEGITFSITSNTNFIGGYVIDQEFSGAEHLLATDWYW
ncbi:MAG: hypothetical protein QXN55_00385 [Candidatus Nitrosotenuis sp.]